MKKLTLALTLLVVTLGGNGLKASENLTAKNAKTYAAYYLSQRSIYPNVTASDLRLVYQITNPDLGIGACYFYNVSDWGWIIMAANTTFSPVIGYSDEGQNLDTNELPENMMGFIQDYANNIIGIQNYERDYGYSFPTHTNWLKLAAKSLTPRTKGGKHDFFKKGSNPIKWHQGNESGNVYNGRCPKIDGVNCVTGCVATALAQIVYYYEYPVKPTGSKRYRWRGQQLALNFDTMSFDYSKMGPSVASTSDDSKKNEVSKLCYAVGVCMEITYNTAANGGSGAFSGNVAQYMYNNFKYSRCNQIYRESAGNATFVNQIRSELKKNRPVYMSGASSTGTGNDRAGHAWVCCGYDDDDETQYYMNWGWGNSANGWYDLKNNGNGMYIGSDPYNHGYTFNVGQSAMIGLVPPHSDSSAVDFGIPVGISPVVDNGNIGVAYPNPAVNNVTIPYNLSANTDLVIYTIDGKTVKIQQLCAGEGHAVVNLDGMPAGIYLYRIGGASGKFVVK